MGSIRGFSPYRIFRRPTNLGMLACRNRQVHFTNHFKYFSCFSPPPPPSFLSLPIHTSFIPRLYHYSYSTMASATTFYSLKPLDSKGETYDFEALKGKVVLIVNVASK